MQLVNIVLAGIGGQGVLSASDILSELAFRSGKDIKKSEIHGMSQRGGSVTSDIRIGESVKSPMIPEGEADFLLVLSEGQAENNKHKLSQSGVLLNFEDIDVSGLKNKKALNIAVLGLLSTYLDFPEEDWINVIKEAFPEKLQENNLNAFHLGITARK